MNNRVTTPLSICAIQNLKNTLGCKEQWQRESVYTSRMAQSYGFTLLEILVTIIISAILAVILIQVMGNQPWRSFQAIDAYNDSLALKSAMENITADVHSFLNNENLFPAPLIQLQNNLDGVGDFQGYWDPGEPVTVTHYCLEFEPAEDETLGLVESNPHTTCAVTDKILKVKLHNGNQSLTALFTVY